MVFLFVIRQLSDEPYKINAAKNYMVDYLENTCSGRYKKQKAAEKEAINVIAAPNTEKVTPSRDEEIPVSEERASSAKPEPNLSINIEGEPRDAKKGSGYPALGGVPPDHCPGRFCRRAGGLRCV